MLKQIAAILLATAALHASAGAQVFDPKGSAGYRDSTMEALDAARLNPGPTAQPPHMGASIYNGQYNPNLINPFNGGVYNPYATPGFLNGQTYQVPYNGQQPYVQPYPYQQYNGGYYQNGSMYPNVNLPYNYNGVNPLDPYFRRRR